MGQVPNIQQELIKLKLKIKELINSLLKKLSMDQFLTIF